MKQLNHSTISRKRAFTLIEVLVYMGLFTTTVALVMLTLFQSLDASDAQRNRLTVEAEADFMLRKIAWAMRGASTIHAPSGGATSTQLKVDKYEFGANPILFERIENSLVLSRASSTIGNLSSSRVRITDFVVTHLPKELEKPPGVSVVLSVAATSLGNRSEFASTTLKDTFYLRK